MSLGLALGNRWWHCVSQVGKELTEIEGLERIKESLSAALFVTHSCGSSFARTVVHCSVRAILRTRSTGKRRAPAVPIGFRYPLAWEGWREPTFWTGRSGTASCAGPTAEPGRNW